MIQALVEPISASPPEAIPRQGGGGVTSRDSPRRQTETAMQGEDPVAQPR